MKCTSSLSISSIQNISIRKKVHSSWDTIVTLMNAKNTTPSMNYSNDLARKAVVDRSFGDNITLTLKVNESDLVCEDEGLYQCLVSNKDGQCSGEANEELKGFCKLFIFLYT